MGILSNLFKPKPKITVETEFGQFSLVYSKRDKNLWSKEGSEISMTVRGTNTIPDPEQIKFLLGVKNEIDKLLDKITKKFKRGLEEAELPVNFKAWSDRFKIVGIEVMLIFEKETYWNITFEDQEEPFAHFTIFIEGDRIGPDFSIDT